MLNLLAGTWAMESWLTRMLVPSVALRPSSLEVRLSGAPMAVNSLQPEEPTSPVIAVGRRAGGQALVDEVVIQRAGGERAGHAQDDYFHHGRVQAGTFNKKISMKKTLIYIINNY